MACMAREKKWLVIIIYKNSIIIYRFESHRGIDSKIKEKESWEIRNEKKSILNKEIVTTNALHMATHNAERSTRLVLLFYSPHLNVSVELNDDCEGALIQNSPLYNL